MHSGNPFKPTPSAKPVEETKQEVRGTTSFEVKDPDFKTISDLLNKEKEAAEEISAAEGLSKDQTDTFTASTQEPAKQITAKQEAKQRKVPFVGTVESKAVNEIDLDKLDETTLLRYPIIAKSLTDSAMATIKPKSNTLVFRWVYFNNGIIRGSQDKVTATNVGRYTYMGFEFATVEDVEGGEDALIEGIIDDGGKIINYDTVLMKVDKLRLMGHYKQNLLSSISRVDGALSRAKKSAEGQVQQTSEYQKAMATHPQARIEFFETK